MIKKFLTLLFISIVLNSFAQAKKVSIDKDSLAKSSQELSCIYDFTFYLPTELEEWYNKNHEKGKKSEEWIIGEFYSNPSSKSIKVGELLTYFKPEVNNFVLQFKSTDENIKNEFTEIGDWGYGLHINVIDTTNLFVKVPMKYFQTSAWLRYGDHSTIEVSKNRPIIYGNYASYLKNIVSLPRVTVTEVVTNKQTFIEAGTYFIETSSKEGFILRKEMSEDMPCGGDPDLEIDKKVLKRYLLKIKDLKDNKGNYQIEIAYPRGC